MNKWIRCLNGDLTEWLPGSNCPPIRYGMLVDIADRPPDDPQVLAAKAAIPAYPPVAELLAAQQPGGYWERPDYYQPRTERGTFWVLSVLGDLGLTAEDDHIRRGCDFMFDHQHKNGEFGRRRKVPGQGTVWQENPEPCTHARIVRFLIQFGFGGDPRVRSAIDWLLPRQREDGMWFCRGDGKTGCLRATLDFLRVAALDPETASRPETARAAEAVCNLLMEPRLNRYHVGGMWGSWERLKYPYFGVSLISALDALAQLGYTAGEPKIAGAVEYLLSRQLPGGAWPLDERWPHPPIDFGPAGEPNQWVTLDALRVIKMLC